MQPLNALSLTSAVNGWLMNSRQPRILHVFDHVCNLINERREVLSIVTSQVGNGPFNLVIADEVLFSKYLNIESSIHILKNQLTLDDLTIHTASAQQWNPRPAWERFHAAKGDLLNRLILLQNSDDLLSLPASLRSTFITSVVNVDIAGSIAAAKNLAGLGVGLTPAGDDFILGAILAAWIIHPLEIASRLAEEITNVAAPLTTSLSAAWLRSAGKGEAGVLWHEFLHALLFADSEQIQTAMDNILATGETSGADALAGFMGTFLSYAEHGQNYVIPKHLL